MKSRIQQYRGAYMTDGDGDIHLSMVFDAELLEAQGNIVETTIKLSDSGLTLQEKGKEKSYHLDWDEIIEAALLKAGRSQYRQPDAPGRSQVNQILSTVLKGKEL